MYLLDTNHCSLIFLKNQTIVNYIEEVGETNIATTIITVGELIYMAENSTYKELIKANNQLKDAESRRKLIRNGLIKRNIATKTGEERFVFTPASKVFINFALDLARQRSAETEAEGARS